LRPTVPPPSQPAAPPTSLVLVRTHLPTPWSTHPPLGMPPSRPQPPLLQALLRRLMAGAPRRQARSTLFSSKAPSSTAASKALAKRVNLTWEVVHAPRSGGRV
jgi:hypothetical protein